MSLWFIHCWDPYLNEKVYWMISRPCYVINYKKSNLFHNEWKLETLNLNKDIFHVKDLASCQSTISILKYKVHIQKRFVKLFSFPLLWENSGKRSHISNQLRASLWNTLDHLKLYNFCIKINKKNKSRELVEFLVTPLILVRRRKIYVVFDNWWPTAL